VLQNEAKAKSQESHANSLPLPQTTNPKRATCGLLLLQGAVVRAVCCVLCVCVVCCVLCIWHVMACEMACRIGYCCLLLVCCLMFDNRACAQNLNTAPATTTDGPRRFCAPPQRGQGLDKNKRPDAGKPDDIPTPALSCPS
jgi:hypothetical protein